MGDCEYIVKLPWSNQFLAVKSMYSICEMAQDTEECIINFHFSWYKGLVVRASLVDSGTCKLISELSYSSDLL